MGKSKDKIRVSFGYNSEHVTGSYTLINCGESKKQILVDYGLIQEPQSTLATYRINSKRPDFKIKNISLIFATHCHIDHIGRICQLVKMGYNNPIIIPHGARKIFFEMCCDSARILEKDSLELQKKYKDREYSPIYSKEDVLATMDLIHEAEPGEKIVFDDDISYEFNHTGHILSACSLTLWIKNGSQTRKIAITGDLGNLSVPQKFAEKFVPIESCNLLIGEATYGDKSRPSPKMKDREKDLEKIKSGIITTCIDKSGTVLIPTFAYGRSPTILRTLYEIFKDEKYDIPFYYASPLGTKLLNIYLQELKGEQKIELTEALEWPQLKILNSFDELDALLKSSKPKVICVPSGMCNAGYSVYVASKLLPHANNLIMFAGYSAEGTLAWKIKQKKTKTISIDGKQISARCGVINLVSFSSHMQYEDLIKLYSGTLMGSNSQYDIVALVHSDFKTKHSFCKELQNEISNKCKSTKVVCVNSSTEIKV